MIKKRLLRFALCQNLSGLFKVINYGLKHRINHNETIVPVIPLRSHSSAIRFSALRFISSERLNRAKASSYVIFLVPIFTHYYI